MKCSIIVRVRLGVSGIVGVLLWSSVEIVCRRVRRGRVIG
jgi:hypothetical protein